MDQLQRLSQIDYGELEVQINNAIKTCVKDINDDPELEQKRAVDVKIIFTPDHENSNVEISYDVTPKLAKRNGKQTVTIDKGSLFFAEGY